MDSTDHVDNSGVMELTKNIMIMSFIALFFFIIFALLVYYFSNGRQQATIYTNDPVSEQQRGLDASFLKTMRVIVFDPKDFKEGLECAVCLSDLEEGEEARILPKCDHAFHVECIDMWFHSHSTCPVCRNPLISDQVEIILEQEEEAMNAAMVEDDDNADNNHDHHDSGSEQATSSSMQADKNRERPDLVIDIPPRQEANEEDDEKTPGSFSRSMRSLKRILSSNSRFNPFSPRP
uniref:RING-H2 finger protein ATL60-like n=1 Tax=Erigeron canadensis TaxID=72917 RepID=UPI001CB957D0|nr:RING-H2 finger protein ATL60-like [Erigeron canadensis]